MDGNNMTDTSQAAASVDPVDYSERRTEPTGWTGWVFFAGLMMITLGAFQAMMGFVALLDDQYYLVTRNGLVVSVDYTTWGWIHLVLGTVAFFAGFAVMFGQMWGRVVGIILAIVSAIVNMAFVAAYPVWSMIVITIDVIVIYALAVHGREAKEYTN
jgi:hypothetical protein